MYPCKSIEDLIASEKAFFSPIDICGVLGSDPQTIRITARQRPDLIHYPFTFTGTRMKIPKGPFLKFMGVENF